MALSDVDLQGKTALITGSAKRLGKAIALALAQHGVNIILHYHLSQEHAEQLANDIEHKGVKADLVQEDLGTLQNADALMQKAIQCNGTVDFLINNASIFPESTIASASLKELNFSAQVNAYAPLLISRSFFRQSGKGAIINMLDTKVVSSDDRHFAYWMSKQTLYALTKQMARLFAPHVRVNGIAPGLILPPQGKDHTFLENASHRNVLHTYGDIRDISETVIYLLKMNFITGQVLFVDGGEHLKGTQI